MAAFKLTKQQQEELLEHLRAGKRRGDAAEVLELDRRKTREYILEHPEFEKAVLDAELDALEAVEEALFQAAISGSVAAAKAWLDLKGQGIRPAAAGAPTGASQPSSAPDYADLDNVTPMDPRRRRG